MCSASTVYRSLVESRLQPGEWVVFPGGGGGVGIQGVQLAKAMGLRPVVIDTGAAKKDLCMKVGAEAFVDFKESKDVTAEVIKIADGVGAHGVIVTAPSAYNSAISLVGDRIGAKVMCIGLRMSSLIHLPSFQILLCLPIPTLDRPTVVLINLTIQHRQAQQPSAPTPLSSPSRT